MAGETIKMKSKGPIGLGKPRGYDGISPKTFKMVHSPDPVGWTKVKNGAFYADVSVRTFRPWLTKGLRHVRLPSGTILTKFIWIDKFLEQFEVNVKRDQRQIDETVDEILGDL